MTDLHPTADAELVDEIAAAIEGPEIDYLGSDDLEGRLRAEAAAVLAVPRIAEALARDAAIARIVAKRRSRPYVHDANNAMLGFLDVAGLYPVSGEART